MNTTTILLGVTGVTLLIALILSITGLQNSTKEPENLKRIALLEKETAALKAATLAHRKAIYPVSPTYPQASYPPANSSTNTSASTSAATDSISDDEKKQLAELKKQLADSKANEEAAKELASMKTEEAEIVTEKTRRAEMRDKRNQAAVRNASLLGNVTAYNKEYAFMTFTPALQRNYKQGEKLAIRRGSGILCRAVVDSFSENGVVANVLPNGLAGGFAEIRAGDEVILLPQYYDPPEEVYNAPLAPSSPTFVPSGGSIELPVE